MPKKMNLISKLHQDFVIDKIQKTDWAVVGSESPLVVELDTTEACDLACPGCISEDMMKTNNRFTNERLLQLGKEFYENGIKGVVLIGGGEPLAHPAIGDFMEYLGEHDIHLGITTNGTFIKKYLKQIAMYSSWTRVSMDAATSETFKVLRPSKGGKSKFDSIVENMRLLAEVKQGKLGYSFLIQTPKDGPGLVSNIHEIYQAAKLARDIGCDYFEVKPSYRFRDGIDHALMVQDEMLMSQAKDEIARLDDLVTDDFSVTKAINLDFSLEGKQLVQPKDYNICPVAEFRTLICPSGVFVCPYWRAKEPFRIGDLNNHSFSEMWHGERRKEVMDFLNPSKQCTFHCLRHESNLEVINIVRAINDGKEVDTVDEFDRFI
jgi:MoaA/NifB/PqqE/SkfB family radical SAM enzyme